MGSIQISAEHYSFPKITNGEARHWQHLVAKLQVTLFVKSDLLERIVVEVQDLILENIDCKVNIPTIECGRGSALGFKMKESDFRLRFNPHSYAQVMRFLEKNSIPVLLYDAPGWRSSLVHRPSSSVMGNSIVLSSSALYVASPSSMSLSSSSGYCVQPTSSRWVDSVVTSDFSCLVNRYGISLHGSRRWRFIYRSSFISCLVKIATLDLVVSAGMNTLHSVNLNTEPISWAGNTVTFTENGDRVKIKLKNEFVHRLVLVLKYLGLTTNTRAIMPRSDEIGPSSPPLFCSYVSQY